MEQGGLCTKSKGKILKLFGGNLSITSRALCGTASLGTLGIAGIKYVSGLSALALCPKTTDCHLLYSLGTGKRSSVKILLLPSTGEVSESQGSLYKLCLGKNHSGAILPTNPDVS